MIMRLIVCQSTLETRPNEALTHTGPACRPHPWAVPKLKECPPSLAMLAWDRMQIDYRNISEHKICSEYIINHAWRDEPRKSAAGERPFRQQAELEKP
jgi:hypothetical protein